MESVAWVETLGPRGHVLNRQPVFKWPVLISHNYDGDVVVDEPSPDGQVKLLHLWPPKLLHLSWARLANYGVDSVAVAMRSAASFSR